MPGTKQTYLTHLNRHTYTYADNCSKSSRTCEIALEMKQPRESLEPLEGVCCNNWAQTDKISDVDTKGHMGGPHWFWRVWWGQSYSNRGSRIWWWKHWSHSGNAKKLILLTMEEYGLSVSIKINIAPRCGKQQSKNWDKVLRTHKSNQLVLMRVACD